MPGLPELRPDLLAERLEEVRQRIQRASGARPVRVVAVSKGFDARVVRAAVQAGIEDLGENYADELLRKAPAAPACRWHFLGALQGNKLAKLVPYVHLWHSLDSQAAADALGKKRPGAAVLVQVKVAGGPQRRGVPPDGAAALVRHAQGVGLEVRGLMVVGPAGGQADEVRGSFRTVARLGHGLGLPELSMGMSDDFEAAVEEGATIVRLGRALFGERPRRQERAVCEAPEGSGARLGL